MDIKKLWEEYENMHFSHYQGRSCLAYTWQHFLQGTPLDVIENWFKKQGLDTLTGDMK